MVSGTATQKTPTRLVLTRIPDSWAWMRPDLLVRLLPFTVAYTIAYAASGSAGWLGLGFGNVAAQLIFAVAAVPAMFVAAVVVQRLLPGPPSLLGVSLAHIAATCGFLGPGPYLLQKMRLV